MCLSEKIPQYNCFTIVAQAPHRPCTAGLSISRDRIQLTYRSIAGQGFAPPTATAAREPMAISHDFCPSLNTPWALSLGHGVGEQPPFEAFDGHPRGVQTACAAGALAPALQVDTAVLLMLTFVCATWLVERIRHSSHTFPPECPQTPNRAILQPSKLGLPRRGVFPLPLQGTSAIVMRSLARHVLPRRVSCRSIAIGRY